MTRWLERIVELMSFEIEHRQRQLHSNADGLILIADYSNVVSAAKTEQPAGNVYSAKIKRYPDNSVHA